MGEAKKKLEAKTLQTIEQEYFQICARYGDLAYRIATKQQEMELKQLEEKIKVLNKEAKALHDREEQRKDLANKPVTPNVNEEEKNESVQENEEESYSATNDPS